MKELDQLQLRRENADLQISLNSQRIVALQQVVARVFFSVILPQVLHRRSLHPSPPVTVTH
jgi:hypothetical protein